MDYNGKYVFEISTSKMNIYSRRMEGKYAKK